MNYCKHQIQHFIFITCLFLLSTISLFAQQNHGKIKGTITTSDGGPAADVNVTLKNSKYNTITNDSGNFEFNRVKSNSYTLQVSLIGYESIEKEVIVTENETSVFNLQLKVSDKELKEVVIDNKKRRTSKKTDYVARMPISNLENPQVYSVIPKELLLEQVVIDIKSAVQNSPGVISYNYPAGGVGVAFRGFVTGVNARNGMETVATRSSLDISNVERIEILKGPSGTLFGASISSFGGVVNLVTKKPFEKTAVDISYTGGSYSLNRLTADVNTPLNKDKTVLFRVNMAVNKQHNFQNYGFNNTVAVTPSLTFKASDKLTFNFDAELFNANTTRRAYNTYRAGSGIITPEDLKVDYKTSLFHDDVDGTTSASKIFAQAEYEISENWKSTTIYSFVSENVEASYQPYLDWYSPTQVDRKIGLWGPISNNYLNIQENFNGTFSTGSIKHKFLAGLNYRLYDGSRRAGGNVATLDNVNVTTNPAPIRRKAYDNVIVLYTSNIAIEKTFSAYACDVVNFNDRLSAMLSLRLDNFNREAVGTTKAYNQNSLAPKLGLVYHVVKDQVSIFGNYMNGFQNVAPVDLKAPLTGTAVLDPVYAVQYEGGIKAEAFNNKLNATASYYNITIDNAVRNDANGNPVQDGKQVSKGFEFELTANPISGLNLTAGYAYNDNRIVKSTNAAIEGNKAGASPENVVNFWASYTLQNKLKGLGAGFGANYVDENYFSTDNTVYMPAYTVYNATVYYDQAKWRVGAKLNNISNEKYWDIGGNSQAPINFALNLTFKF
ncbi:MAG: TonB-dependent receptor [Bacteroidota bacterium]